MYVTGTELILCSRIRGVPRLRSSGWRYLPLIPRSNETQGDDTEVHAPYDECNALNPAATRLLDLSLMASIGPDQ